MVSPQTLWRRTEFSGISYLKISTFPFLQPKSQGDFSPVFPGRARPSSWGWNSQSAETPVSLGSPGVSVSRTCLQRASLLLWHSFPRRLLLMSFCSSGLWFCAFTRLSPWLGGSSLPCDLPFAADLRIADLSLPFAWLLTWVRVRWGPLSCAPWEQGPELVHSAFSTLSPSLAPGLGLSMVLGVSFPSCPACTGMALCSVSPYFASSCPSTLFTPQPKQTGSLPQPWVKGALLTPGRSQSRFPRLNACSPLIFCWGYTQPSTFGEKDIFFLNKGSYRLPPVTLHRLVRACSLLF